MTCIYCGGSVFSTFVWPTNDPVRECNGCRKIFASGVDCLYCARLQFLAGRAMACCNSRRPASCPRPLHRSSGKQLYSDVAWIRSARQHPRQDRAHARPA
jgi:hypothetical protein